LPDYDFRALSSFDFESLVRDLLQQELKERLEVFKSGKDKGIDLRYSSVTGDQFIVQCKHFVESGFQKLKYHLKESELSKIRRLNPERYALATSVPLSPPNKDDLMAILRPYCISTADIFGKGDLNNLLGRHLDVEKQHFKLWLSSSAVLERTLNSTLYNESTLERNRIIDRMKRYVQNASYFDAISILNQLHYCIICGIPGIGKTTLAELLLITLINDDYTPYKITDNISVAIGAFRPEQRQVFYYDDFLRQSTLESNLEKNEDERLVRFLDLAHRSDKHRFILTTPEYILNQAKQRYERLENSRFDLQRCTITLESYTKKNKAEILFNHLYFSAIDKQHREAVVRDRSYMKIVSHPNYSPRIIEWMTDHLGLSSVSPENYVAEFISNLDDPSRLWRHAFEHQISDAARRLLLVLITMPKDVELNDLRCAYESLCRIQAINYNLGWRPQDFELALKELDGNFVRSERKEDLFSFLFGTPPEPDNIVISLHNASISDFIRKYVTDRRSVFVDLITSAVFFEQVEEICQIRTAVGPTEIVRAHLLTIPKALSDAIRSTAGFDRSYDPTIRPSHLKLQRWESEWREIRAVEIVRIAKAVESTEVSAVVIEILGCLIEGWVQGCGSLASGLHVLRTIRGVKIIPEQIRHRAIESLATRLSSGFTDLDDYSAFVGFALSYGEFVDQDAHDEVKWAFEHWVNSEIYQVCSDIDDPDRINELISKIEHLGGYFGVDVETAVDAASERRRELDLEIDSLSESQTLPPGRRSTDDRDTDSYIDSLFSSLQDIP
jgi:Novel STAND NTPase 3/Restriction endonuclease